MISFGNEFDALQSVAQNVAKNRNSSVIGRQDGEQVLRRIIEKENDIRMLGSLLRSYAGPHHTWLVTEKSMTCRDGQKRRANLQRKLCVQERHFRSSQAPEYCNRDCRPVRHLALRGQRLLLSQEQIKQHIQNRNS
jgi:hypothetical protein